MQKTEPAEPLITVIYKPDSTLMGGENLPSPSFPCSSSTPRSSYTSLLLTASLLLSSSFPFIHFDVVSVDSNTFAVSSLFLLSIFFSFFFLFYRFEMKAGWRGNPRKQRQNASAKDKLILPALSPWASLWSGNGPRQSSRQNSPSGCFQRSQRLSCRQVCLCRSGNGGLKSIPRLSSEPGGDNRGIMAPGSCCGPSGWTCGGGPESAGVSGSGGGAGDGKAWGGQVKGHSKESGASLASERPEPLGDGHSPGFSSITRFPEDRRTQS